MAHQENNTNDKTTTKQTGNESDTTTAETAFSTKDFKIGKDFKTRHHYGNPNSYIETDWGPGQITKQEVFSKDGVRLDPRTGIPMTLDSFDLVKLKMKREQEQLDERIRIGRQHYENVAGAYYHIGMAIKSLRAANIGNHLQKLKRDKIYRATDLEDFARKKYDSNIQTLINTLQSLRPLIQQTNKLIKHYERLEKKDK